MKKTIFKGVGTAIATPFTDNGINYSVLGKFIDFQIDGGVDSIIVCGTTGEAVTMSFEEKKSVIDFVVRKVDGRIPVIAGTGCNNTNEAVKMTQLAERLGVDGALIVSPYYNKTTQEGIVRHYETISKNTNLPIILYNVPSRTGLNIEPNTCFKLAQIDNIVAIKEASGNISQIAKIRNLCGENLQIYSGNDDQIVPIFSLGGIGVISVLSNIMPSYVKKIIQACYDSANKEAEKLQIGVIGLIEELFKSTNPIPVKAALNLIGFDFGEPRLPLVSMSEKDKNNLDELMIKIFKKSDR